jgi:hypothetical protein
MKWIGDEKPLARLNARASLHSAHSARKDKAKSVKWMRIWVVLQAQARIGPRFRAKGVGRGSGAGAVRADETCTTTRAP